MEFLLRTPCECGSRFHKTPVTGDYPLHGLTPVQRRERRRLLAEAALRVGHRRTRTPLAAVSARSAAHREEVLGTPHATLRLDQ